MLHFKSEVAVHHTQTPIPPIPTIKVLYEFSFHVLDSNRFAKYSLFQYDLQKD